MQQEMARDQAAKPVNEITPTELLIALLSKNRAREMKRLLAVNMSAVENTLSTLEAGNGTVILTERNLVALKVLNKTLKDSKNKKIAIFYGAAHMPDMARRLKKDMGFQESGHFFRKRIMKISNFTGWQKIVECGAKSLDSVVFL